MKWLFDRCRTLEKVAESIKDTTYHGHRTDFGDCQICRALKEAGYDD